MSFGQCSRRYRAASLVTPRHSFSASVVRFFSAANFLAPASVTPLPVRFSAVSFFRDAATAAAPASVTAGFCPRFSVSRFSQNRATRATPTSVTRPPHISSDFNARISRSAPTPASVTSAANRSSDSNERRSAMRLTPRSEMSRESRERLRSVCFSSSKCSTPSSSMSVCPRSRCVKRVARRASASTPSLPTSVSASVTDSRSGRLDSARAAPSPTGHESRFTWRSALMSRIDRAPSSLISVNAAFKPTSDEAKAPATRTPARPVTRVASRESSRSAGGPVAGGDEAASPRAPPTPVSKPREKPVKTASASSSNGVPVKSSATRLGSRRIAAAAAAPARVLASTSFLSAFKPPSVAMSASETRLHHPRLSVSSVSSAASAGTPTT